MVHSVPLAASDYPSLLKWDSIVETHYLLSLPLKDFANQQALGRLRPVDLELVLTGARQLLT